MWFRATSDPARSLQCIGRHQTMRNTVGAISWECGDCGLPVDEDESFAWCDGCAKLLCEECLDEATTCEKCDLMVCRHCSLRRFSLSCDGCGVEIHTDCPAGASVHALCEACQQEDAKSLAS